MDGRLGASTWDPNTVQEWNDLLAMQGYEEYQVTAEKSQALINDSLNIVEHIAGMRVENTSILHYENNRLYYNSFTNEDGIEDLVLVIVENRGHMPSGFDAEIVWEFLSQFSRNPETGELMVSES
ncbi:MAG: hypothetical protein SO016_06435 [Lachnospiraceae bacterium]|nr:hypothetical protein [Robinsoniella sp.]MDY3766323.1 hypothetical protein [Lachnospiraceae bacterium]